MKRVLYVHSRKASFVAIDREILAERYEVEDLYQPGRCRDSTAVIRGVLRADLVFGWFASWHTFLPITLAWLLRKPSVMIVGGFDTANMPDIGYGYQQGGLRRWASRWIMRRATRLVTNSEYSRAEIERNTPIPPARVTVVHHGVPDPFGELPPRRPEPLALTVGRLVAVDARAEGPPPVRGRGGRAARRALRVRRALARRRDRASCARSPATTSSFTGWLSDEELHDAYRRASVYVQASRHEGFGLAVAEAMLAGCVPVVMNVTAMPEVVGDAGVLIDSQAPGGRGRGHPPRAGARARRPAPARASGFSPRSRCAGAATGCCGSSVRPSSV